MKWCLSQLFTQEKREHVAQKQAQAKHLFLDGEEMAVCVYTMRYPLAQKGKNSKAHHNTDESQKRYFAQMTTYSLTSEI